MPRSYTRLILLSDQEGQDTRPGGRSGLHGKGVSHSRMASHHPIRKAAAAMPVIPDKLYFRIGEVARLCAVPAYVLRFWETEFPQLKPNKGGTGQRLYRRRDVEIALRIKHLLYDQGYTIPGARQVLRSDAARSDSAAEVSAPSELNAAGSEPGTAGPEIHASNPERKASGPRPMEGAPALAAQQPLHGRRLRALREDLRTLAAELAQPPAPALPPTPRPRLVVDRKAAAKSSRPEPETAARNPPAGAPAHHGPLPGQGDLFPGE